MTKKRQKSDFESGTPSSSPPEIPGWLNRVQMGLRSVPRIDPLASPYMRGLEAQHDLLKRAGGTLSSEEVAGALRISRQAVDKRRQAGKLIAIPQGQHRYVYPACQLGERGGTLTGLEDLLGQLGDRDGWMQLSYLMTPNADLNSQSPYELMRKGVVAPVIEAAARFGEQGAQ